MSLFQCVFGHEILPSAGFCQLCREVGLPGKIHSMDGITNNEYQEMVGLEEGDIDLDYEDDAWEVFEEEDDDWEVVEDVEEVPYEIADEDDDWEEDDEL